jgi:uncharacterized membrane protein YbaN (DUF454 family)
VSAPADRRPPWKKTLRIALGILLVIIGIIGWLLPIVPGWPALIPGLVILSDYSPFAKRMLDKVRAAVNMGKKK